MVHSIPSQKLRSPSTTSPPGLQSCPHCQCARAEPAGEPHRLRPPCPPRLTRPEAATKGSQTPALDPILSAARSAALGTSGVGEAGRGCRKAHPRTRPDEERGGEL